MRQIIQENFKHGFPWNPNTHVHVSITPVSNASLKHIFFTDFFNWISKMTVFLGETEIHVCTMYMYFNCFFPYSKLWYKIWNNVLQEDCTWINTLFNLPYSKCDYFVDSKMDLISILPCKPGNYFYVALLAHCYFHISHPVMNSKISFIH